jgi:hypothetical protein
MNQILQSSRCEQATDITRGEYSWHSWLNTLVPALKMCHWCQQVRVCPACWCGRPIPAGVRLVRCLQHGGNLFEQ